MRRQARSCHEAGHGHSVAAVAGVRAGGQQRSHHRLFRGKLGGGAVVEGDLDSGARGGQHPQVGIRVRLPRKEGFRVSFSASCIALGF